MSKICSKDVPHFSDVLDVIVDHLRDVYFANRDDVHEIQWPNDLRLQPYRNCYARQRGLDYRQYDGSKTSEAFDIIKALNLLNRHAHSVSRRVLGYSLTLEPPCTSSAPLKSYMNDFGLLDTCTRIFIFREDVERLIDSEEVMENGLLEYRRRFLQVFSNRASSLRILQVAFTDPGIIKTSLKAMIAGSPCLEELCLSFARSSSLFGLIEELFGPNSHSSDGWKQRSTSTLRVIRLRNFAIRDPSRVDHGLPSDASPLLMFDSVTTIHFYTPYRDDGSETEKMFRQSLQKLTWVREAGMDFTLDSIWIRNVQGVLPIMAAHEVELLKSTPNITLEVTYHTAPSTMPVVAGGRSSLQTLTILSDDFLTHDSLRNIPKKLNLLIIRFKAHFCRSEPRFLDGRLHGALQVRDIKNVRLCIGTSRGNYSETPLFNHSGPLFAKPDSTIFAKCRELCIQRGGQFILENLWSVPEDKSNSQGAGYSESRIMNELRVL